jgi:2-phospho-L-lactate/phosphoenolpyruvate guanylyltransferase
MSLMILIPCKALERGKSRLARCLSPRSRQALCEFFLCRTLDLATAVAEPARIAVVTADARVATIAGKYGVAAIADDGADLNGALAHGRDRIVAERGNCAMLILPIDLPLATPAALAAVAAARGDAVIVPDEASEGTNVLRLGPTVLRAFRFAYGPQSFRHHCEEARTLGGTASLIRDPALMFDVDRPEDYRRWVALHDR